MIQLEDISHQFNEHRVIENFNLSIPKGKIVSLIGKSGCGKSTLLNIVGGFIQPTHGKVMINEKLKLKPSPDCLMLFQHHNLLPWKNIYKNLTIGLNQTMSRETLDTYLQSVDLGQIGTHFPDHLSGGMKQRVAICRALIHKPQVILMDEPLGALDTFTRYKLQDALLTLKSNAASTILLVTHDIDEALYLSDEIILLGDKGSIINQYQVTEPHPRNRNHSTLIHLRQQIMEDFSLLHQSVEPEYYI
ncbi:ABC transporter ATP-binding protein [Staphylococcus massiliensis]|uniref:ABC transporter ATP-binding protein n=1 Tax=Staphylococcus massiliensis TaxID=555791 RepID=UPI001EE11717|nr:ABC transporter ATP-binding protein [Staphylococcus massiliensis]MCG3399736.1 ABC transporter ATP-binding protein [Staphylococcus massiliensis]